MKRLSFLKRIAVYKMFQLYFEIADNETPSLECFDDQSVLTDDGKPTAMVEWEDPHASDNSGIVSVTCDPQSGTNFTIGQTSINCEAVDGSRNKAQCSVQVIVAGKFVYSIIHKTHMVYKFLY